MDTKSSIDNFVRSRPRATLPIVQKLRKVVKAPFPEAKEILYHETLGYSQSGSPYDRILYIWPLEKHVTLGFFFGTSLPDHNRLLTGEGKRMRHVKVRTVEEAANPALAKLVKSARPGTTKSLESIHRRREGKP